MNNRLSFMNSFFVLLLIGKIGHIGTLGAVSWAWVFLPLLLDLIMDFLTKMGYVDAAIARLIVRLKVREVQKIANRLKDKDNG